MIRELDIGDSCFMWLGHKCQWTDQDWIELFEVLVHLPALIKIRRSMLCFWNRQTNFSHIEPNLLVNVFKRLEEIHLSGQLIHEQSDQLFSAIAENKCSLKLLMVWGESQIMLNPQLFASAVSNVDQVLLGSEDITHEQMEALFIALTEKRRQLRRLELSSCNTEDIEPALMGEAVSSLEEFIVVNTWVKSGQISAILENIVKGGSRLKKLKLCELFHEDFMEVDPDLVKQVYDKYGKFYCFDTDPDDVHDHDSDIARDSDEYNEDATDDDNEYLEEVKRLSDIYNVNNVI